MIERAALIVAGLILAGWLYWLTDRVQRLLNHAEQLQGAGARLLAQVPGKSAQRTDGADVQPRRWWKRLADATAPVFEEPATEDDSSPDEVHRIPTGARPAPLRTDTVESDQVVDAAVTRVLDAMDRYGRHAHGTRP